MSGGGYRHGYSTGGRGGVRALMPSVAPFRSFFQWQRHVEQDGGGQSETYEKYQIEYVRSLRDAMFEESWRHEWFLAKYDPMKLLEQWETLKARSLRISAVLSERVLRKASVDAERKVGEIGQSPSQLTAGLSLACLHEDRRDDLNEAPSLHGLPGLHDEAHRLVTLRHIPPWCPSGAIQAVLDAAATPLNFAGVVDDSLFTSSAPNDDREGSESSSSIQHLIVGDGSRGRGRSYHATYWVLYKDAAAAECAAPTLSTRNSSGYVGAARSATNSTGGGSRLDGLEVSHTTTVDYGDNEDMDEAGNTLRFRLSGVEKYRSRRPRMCPDMFAHPDRISFDLKAAKTLALALDAERGIDEHSLTGVLAHADVQRALKAAQVDGDRRKADRIRLAKEAYEEAAAAATVAADEARLWAERVESAKKVELEATAKANESAMAATAAAAAAAVAVLTAAGVDSAPNDSGVLQSVEDGQGMPSTGDAVSGATEPLSPEAQIALDAAYARAAAASEVAAAAVASSSVVFNMLDKHSAAEEAGEMVRVAEGSADGAVALIALELDLCIAWLRVVHLFAYYGGNECRDEGDLLDSEDAVYVRPFFKLMTRQGASSIITAGPRKGRSRRDRNETTGTLGNIDLKLAMRCQVLLEAGRVLEAKSDISGARAKYEEVRGLGIYFQAMDIGSQVIAGAQLAINNAESNSPNLNERVPEKMKHETVEAPDIHDKALEGDNRGSEDAEGDSEALISVKRRRMDEYEEDGTTTANASANISETINIIADSKAMSWAQGVSSSSLAFAKEMDSRIEARTCQALTGIADTTKINSAVTCIGCSDLRAAAASLKELLLTAEEAWVVDHMNFEPNKTDPSKTNARCKFPWCGKLFKEEKFLRKHLLSKHATQLNYQVLSKAEIS